MGHEDVVERDRNSSGHNVVKGLQLEKATSGLSVLLVARVVYRVAEVMRHRRVAQAVLTVRLGRCDVGAIVGRGSVHGRLERRTALSGLSTRDCARRDVTRRSAAGECSETTLTLLDLGLDAATVRCLTDLRQNGAHGFDEVQAQLRWSELESSLNDIIAV